MVSISMPEKPNALSPSTASTGLPVSIEAAMAEPMPMPITPQVPTRARERAVIIHLRVVVHQPRRHLGDVLFPLCLDGIEPVRWRGRPVAAHRIEQRGNAGADIADKRGHDLDIGVHLLGLDVDLDEFLGRFAPGLALAM